jgi:hypothetical protein
MTLSIKTRLFLILFFSGMVGVLSFLLVDLSALISLMPVPAGTEAPTVTPALKVLGLIQPSVLVALAVLIGVLLAPKVGLSAPVAEAFAARSPIASKLKPQVLPGIIGGALGAIFVVVCSAIIRPFLLAEVIELSRKFAELLPLPTRLFYGGITEELLLRWGFMTLLVWLGWRFIQKRKSPPTTKVVVGSILLSALVFAIGHLPITFMLMPEANAAIVAFVITANSAFGLICGYLYWKRGLEAAIIAHMVGHLVMVSASSLGL